MSKLLRVVIDTNHIMSAILSARGASAKLIDWMTSEEDSGFSVRRLYLVSIGLSRSNPMKVLGKRSRGIIGKSAPILADITIRKSPLPSPHP